MSGCVIEHRLAVDLEVLTLRGRSSHAAMVVTQHFPHRAATVVTYCGAMPKLTELPFQAAAHIQQYAERGSAELHYARKMFEAGALKLEPPQNIAAFVADIRRWGEFGMIPALNARRTPDGTAVVDDDGEITFKELDEAAHAVANGLLAMGVKGGDGVAILARNHRWFLIALYGAARVGARIILLNSEFSGPQIKEVSERENAKVIIYDDEYTKAVAAGRTAAGQAARARPPTPTRTSRRAAPTRRWPNSSSAAAASRHRRRRSTRRSSS